MGLEGRNLVFESEQTFCFNCQA